MVMNHKTREERLKGAQRIVARNAAKDRDLVAELIAERRAEAAAESSEATYARADLVNVDGRWQDHGGELPASDGAIAQAAAPAQTTKSKGGDP
jgi:hypothetical protein